VCWQSLFRGSSAGRGPGFDYLNLLAEWQSLVGGSETSTEGRDDLAFLPGAPGEWEVHCRFHEMAEDRLTGVIEMRCRFGHSICSRVRLHSFIHTESFSDDDREPGPPSSTDPQAAPGSTPRAPSPGAENGRLRAENEMLRQRFEGLLLQLQQQTEEAGARPQGPGRRARKAFPFFGLELPGAPASRGVWGEVDATAFPSVGVIGVGVSARIDPNPKC